jgi:hypothetical protein
MYKLSHDFLNKWEGYLRKQWSNFAADRSFDELSTYYPLEQMRRAIKKNIGAQNGRK